jgi:dCTP diphosphatase
MADLDKLRDRIVKFNTDRDWKQFHNPKDTAISLVLEATEYLEHFQWKNEKEIEKHLQKDKPAVADELADVLYWYF